MSRGVNITENDLAVIAEKYGYEFQGNEKADFTTLLAATCNAMQYVAEMDGMSRYLFSICDEAILTLIDYQPEPDLKLMPRENMYFVPILLQNENSLVPRYFPEKQDNHDNAWAHRFYLAHKSPTSDLLKGETLCIKDNIAVAGVPCLLGTDSFTGWTPKMDATVVTRILEAGGTIVGKAVCENLSTSAASYTAATGPVDNPYVKGYSAGGSSSGTANLVAKQEVDMGIGADQGGSIRIPASLCGLVGFKATAGLVPYTGCVSNEATIDHVGPMTQNVYDCARLLEAIAGVDGLDDRQQAGTPFRDQLPKYSSLLLETKNKGLNGIRIGILKEGHSSTIIDPAVKAKFLAAAAVFTELGATVEEVSIPMHLVAPAIFGAASKQGGAIGRAGHATGRRQVMLTDLYELMLPRTPEALNKMGPVNKNAVFHGEYCWERFPSVYAKAINLTRKLTETYNTALDSYDVLIMPTTITPADPLPLESDSAVTKMSKTIGKLDNTCPFNATGHPALAFPIGFAEATEEGVKVPVSMQVVGKWWAESLCLRVAFAWEGVRAWKEF